MKTNPNLNIELPTQSDYDRSIHTNPDARAWAEFFNETLVRRGKQPMDPDLMLAWFANAMMAMHDWLLQSRANDATREVRELLTAAAQEIESLQRSSEVLRAKVQVIDIVGRIATNFSGDPMSQSVSWMIRSRLEQLDREERAA